MPAPAEIVQLVELFERNYDQYRSPAFSETAVRHQFIFEPSTSSIPPTSHGTTAWSRWSRRCSICTRAWPRKASRTMPQAGRAPAAD